MEISDKGLSFLIRREGKENKVYKDVAGFPTIGVGHLLTDSERSSGKILIDGCAVRYADGLSDNEIESLLRQDLDIFEGAVNDEADDLEEHEFDALVSFAFNVGETAFRRSTLLRRVKAGASAEEIDRQFMRWVFSGGQKVKGLENRRALESELFRDGVYR